MVNRVRTFWADETGSVPVEWAFLATILVLGAVTGAVAVRHSTLSGADAAASAVVRPAR